MPYHNHANVHSLARAIAEREAARRRGVARQMERLAGAVYRAIEQTGGGLDED